MCRAWVLGARLAALVFVVACTARSDEDDTDVTDTDLTDTDVADTDPDACAAISGRTFASVEELECGLGPVGVELCHWSLTLGADGGFTWRYSDVGESGTWTCVDGVVSADGAGAASYEGSYDPATGTLTWDGHAYE